MSLDGLGLEPRFHIPHVLAHFETPLPRTGMGLELIGSSPGAWLEG